eukprot:Blabericola_migrator_1__5783@NODE_292_length_10275_cov_168_705525_g240_i0_p4_GENE_NODE_292_length_10275_cov_168_705525_g240_i0NODE_292_length_10275_cov_168_705525_g240_i0_p4_ORF_typecomplete_len446_score73_07RRM_1/PF00076_22/1_9e16RRM_5/PF13893_6/0_0022RNA_bind/PF08675_11/0_04Limkainb1/PF11608_8/0_17RRM_7/PF16367_5/0_23_NODE_292_length_10275_cov_168_705525_g240_i065047841
MNPSNTVWQSLHQERQEASLPSYESTESPPLNAPELFDMQYMTYQTEPFAQPTRKPRKSVSVTAAEINKLHQAAKLFRLLPAKTQMILKQVHPQGPLNSDLFAAIMAATECCPPGSPPSGMTASSVSSKRSRSPPPLIKSPSPKLNLLRSAKSEEPVVPTSTHSLTPAQIRLAESNIPRGGLGSQTHGPPGANVFVFHIPNEWVERDLALHFAQFGPLLSARIAADKTTGRRLGFGFVSFTTIAAAKLAVEALNGFSVAGKRLKVTIKRGELQYAAGEKVEQPEATKLTVSTPTASLLPTLPRDDNGSGCSTQNWGSSTAKTTASSHQSKKLMLPKIPQIGCQTSSQEHECCFHHAHRCPSTEAIERLRTIGDILMRVYDRIAATQETHPDEKWLDHLTGLLHTEPGRYFIFTLLMAAGLSLEGGGGGGGRPEEDRSSLTSDDTT